MIDNIKVEIVNQLAFDEFKSMKDPFIFRGILFSPTYSLGFIKYWNGKLENLYLKVIGDCLIITNSIHKYHVGNNYSDFYLADLEKAFKALSKKLNFDVFNATIKSFEVGCNIVLKHSKAFLDGLISYYGNYFQPMNHRNKIKYY